MCIMRDTFPLLLKKLLLFGCALTDLIEIFARPRDARMGIECPGEVIRHTCQIQSALTRLTWRLMIPGQMTVNITFDADNRDNTKLTKDTVAILRSFIDASLIRSEFFIRIVAGMPTDKIMLECFNDNVLERFPVPINTTSKSL